MLEVESGGENATAPVQRKVLVTARSSSRACRSHPVRSAALCVASRAGRRPRSAPPHAAAPPTPTRLFALPPPPAAGPARPAAPTLRPSSFQAPARPAAHSCVLGDADAKGAEKGEARHGERRDGCATGPRKTS
ncbi:hypothetical protein SETIT_5G015700v2 [Setaria italica]|uniref:Uncharacterized protein n=1 Tax=Setaria italica TaxID=4555 RepID=A0A368R037_SETIT|nr:hypothetical protein SETIT_5G015700v2 [Setaria italica]